MVEHLVLTINYTHTREVVIVEVDVGVNHARPKLDGKPDSTWYY